MHVGCSISTVHLFDQIVFFCGLVVLGETTAHYHFCAAVANVLTLAAISPRQTILGLCCYTDSLTSRHFQLQSYISEWWRCYYNASLAWFLFRQGLCMYPVSNVGSFSSEHAQLIKKIANKQNVLFLAIFITQSVNLLIILAHLDPCKVVIGLKAYLAS